MNPRAMARSLGAQKNAARHQMTKQDYEMIVSYLENPDNVTAITGGGLKTKIARKTWTKVTAFGHMAVSLCASCFSPCNGLVMGKKFKRYVKTYKKAHTFYKSTSAGMTDEKVAAGLTIEQKMNLKCPYVFRMHALFGGEEEPIDLSEDDDVIDDQTALVADRDEFYQIAMPNEDSSLEMGNQTARSAVDVEANTTQIP
ncbi:hypothetical protein R1sor_024898 [Riccia sorocarpa]|uniref:Uncharacterized protein n=1 Tax=Riccia sorocarpa TaxID=122646 RepID=A0ABD3GU31_9MARC